MSTQDRQAAALVRLFLGSPDGELSRCYRSDTGQPPDSDLQNVGPSPQKLVHCSSKLTGNYRFLSMTMCQALHVNVRHLI